MIVALEGLDGVGKTTVAGLLRSAYSSCEVLHTPPRTYYDGNREVLCDLHCPARAVLFAAGVLAVNDRLFVNQNQHIPDLPRVRIVDRFVGSITGMNTHLQPQVGNVCRSLSLVMPDLTIELFCDEPVRLQRLKHRGTPLDPFEQRLAGDVELRDAVRRAIREMSTQYVLIDTTRLTALAAAQVCMLRMQECFALSPSDRIMDLAAIENLHIFLVNLGLDLREIEAHLGMGGVGSPSLSPANRLYKQRSVGIGVPKPRRVGVSCDMEDVNQRDNDRHNVSVTINGGFISSLAVGSQDAVASSGDGNIVAARISGADLVARARATISSYLAEQSEPIAYDASEIEQALDDMDRAAAGQPLESSRLNRALEVLEGLMVSAGGSALWALLAQMVTQLV